MTTARSFILVLVCSLISLPTAGLAADKSAGASPDRDGAVAGYVTDGTAKSYGGEVVLIAVGSKYRQKIEIKPDGHFAALVPSGRYKVKIRVIGYKVITGTKWNNEWPEVVPIVCNNPRHAANPQWTVLGPVDGSGIKLTPLGQEPHSESKPIEFQVKDATVGYAFGQITNNGIGVANALVEFLPVSGGAAYSSTTTNSSGFYIDSLLDGVYTVRVTESSLGTFESAPKTFSGGLVACSLAFEDGDDQPCK